METITTQAPHDGAPDTALTVLVGSLDPLLVSGLKQILARRRDESTNSGASTNFRLIDLTQSGRRATFCRTRDAPRREVRA
jgi:hypothetical protein